MRIAIILALGASFIRWTLHANGTLTNGGDFVPFHLLFVLVAVFIAGWRLVRTDPDCNVPRLFRAGFQAGAIYTLIISFFAYALYSWIDPTFFPIRVNEMVDQAMAAGRTEAEARERIEGFFSPFKYATITLFSFVVISAVDAFVCAVLHHKLLRPVRR